MFAKTSGQLWIAIKIIVGALKGNAFFGFILPFRKIHSIACTNMVTYILIPVRISVCSNQCHKFIESEIVNILIIALLLVYSKFPITFSFIEMFL